MLQLQIERIVPASSFSEPKKADIYFLASFITLAVFTPDQRRTVESFSHNLDVQANLKCERANKFREKLQLPM